MPSPKSLRNSYTNSKAFWPRPGMSFEPRTMSHAPTATSAITIHIVSRVLLMLGWKYTPTAGGGAAFGSKLMTVCGAGNSRLLSMKQAGKPHTSPGAPRRNGREGHEGDYVEEDDAGNQAEPAIRQ